MFHFAKKVSHQQCFTDICPQLFRLLQLSSIISSISNKFWRQINQFWVDFWKGRRLRWLCLQELTERSSMGSSDCSRRDRFCKHFRKCRNVGGHAKAPSSFSLSARPEGSGWWDTIGCSTPSQIYSISTSIWYQQLALTPMTERSNTQLTQITSSRVRLRQQFSKSPTLH